MPEVESPSDGSLMSALLTGMVAVMIKNAAIKLGKVERFIKFTNTTR